MSAKVIAIHCSEDGDKSIEFTTKDAFMKKMEDYYLKDGIPLPRFAKPGEEIILDNFSGYILIEGEIVVPKSIEKVTKYEL